MSLNFNKNISKTVTDFGFINDNLDRFCDESCYFAIPLYKSKITQPVLMELFLERP